MAFLGVFWYEFKTFIWKKYSKSKQTKYSGFLKLGVRWAERDSKYEFKYGLDPVWSTKKTQHAWTDISCC